MLYALFVFYSCFHRVLLSSDSTVQIKQGPTIVGLTLRTEDQQKTFHSFRGIPYAIPPIGEQRFMPPVALSNYASVIKAYNEGPSCAQSTIPFVTIGEEDCLYLNVYTPMLKCHTQLPVMIWFHGGFFEIGGHTYQTYHPDYFMNEEVVVVTINYRLNILGFLSTEDMEAPGNYGLKDQILALKWVQKHIKSFCGNESNITVFGESAGSISVSYLTQTPLTKGLFNRAILQSGTSLCPWGLTRNPKLVAFGIGRMLKLNISSSASLVHDLRRIKYEELIAAATIYQLKTLLLETTFSGFVFGPSIEPRHDNAVLTTPSHHNLLNGGYHMIPYIIGFNSGEAFPFIKIIGEYINWYLHRFRLFPNALVPISMNIRNELTRHFVNRHIKHHYFKNVSDNISILNYFNDNEFIRPILESRIF
ncbi:putative inactive carboxylesterase 4 isoform X2 [Photinus pyralis]|uniref:putative inactive carboxylesterase 4 isoform X2 n=1 Tax=Photinus pyralis TaxID=7054 RepID=UPI0012675F9C|nr:putative inactive carboxylesterase 4 isoform X2 [Photinus pyralis]